MDKPKDAGEMIANFWHGENKEVAMEATEIPHLFPDYVKDEQDRRWNLLMDAKQLVEGRPETRILWVMYAHSGLPVIQQGFMVKDWDKLTDFDFVKRSMESFYYDMKDVLNGATQTPSA